MSKVKLIDIGGFACANLLLLALIFRHRRFIHDDAFISLRYAQNLVEHGELTWNLGEYFEGYTNFLYVLVTAGLIETGLDPVLAVQFLNIVAAVLLVFFQAQAGAILLRGDQFAPARAFVLIATGATPAIAVWVLGGLESVVVAMLLSGGLLALLSSSQDRWNITGCALAALAFSLAVLTRLDSAVLVAGAGIGILIGGSENLRRRMIAAVIVAGIPAVIAFTHMAWRIWYYGEFLPLTFYAKTGMDAAVRLAYIPGFAAASLPAVPTIALAALAAAAFLANRKSNPLFWLLAVPFTLQLLYIGWSGGDHMPVARILVPMVVPAGMLLMATMQGLRSRTATLLASSAAVLAMGSAVSVKQRNMDHAAFYGEIIGGYIAAAWPEGSTVALHSAGSTAYVATKMIFIDMLGLNDAHIAKREDIPLVTKFQGLPGHGKGDGRYVLDRKPDYIIAGPAQGKSVESPWFLSDYELAQLPEFERCYKLHVAQIDYDDRMTRLWPGSQHPLTFSYYARTCE